METLPKIKPKFNLIVVSKVKQAALDFAQPPLKFHKFTQVSEDFLLACESNLKEFIRKRVASHPSKGKTLR
jgi:hypothetical protein